MRLTTLMAAFAALLISSAARAEEGAPPRPPGLTLARGKLNVTATFEANLSSDRAFKPFSLAPDVSYGVTDDLTVAVVSSTFAVTGFRGNAGAGFCLAGTDNGCPHVYDNVGVDAIYGLSRGQLALAVVGGFHMLHLDPAWADVRAGARLRFTAGKALLIFSPSVFVGLNDRDQGNKGSIWAPVLLGYKATPPFTLGVGTGIKGPIDGFADGWTIALVPQVWYALSPRMLVGVSFALPKILGADAIPSDQKGVDFRFAQTWLSFTP